MMAQYDKIRKIKKGTAAPAGTNSSVQKLSFCFHWIIVISLIFISYYYSIKKIE